MCAGVIDIVVGTGVLVLSYCNRPENGTEKAAEKTAAREEAPPLSKIDGVAGVMLCVAALTGASSFIYEIGWIRMLSLVLGSSTHSFELMLSAFILGLAIGGFWIRKRLDTFKNPVTALATIQLVMGLAAAASVVFYSNLFYLMRFIMAALSRNDPGYVMFHVYSHLLCLILMLPATIPAGMTLPLITWYLYSRNTDEPMIGRVYASNTLGSIAGVLLAVHLLMPLTGLKNLLIIGGALDMGVALFLLRWKKDPFFQRNTIVFASVMLTAVFFTGVGVRFNPSLLSSGVYRYGKIFKDDGIVYYRDGKTSSVSVRKVPGRYELVNNGKTDASVGFDAGKVVLDEYTQILLAAYPLAFAEKCEHTAVIGLGSGMTATVLLQSDSVKHLDIIEIERYVVDAAKRMGPKVKKAFSDTRSHIYIDDAKTFFASRGREYDCIISEPSNPWVSGVANLFSLEFFDLASRHLAKDGMLVQWFHLYEMGPDLIASVLKAIDRTFSDYRAFICGSDMVLLASNAPIRNLDTHPSVRHPKLTPYLRQIGMDKIYDFGSNCIGGKKTLSSLVCMIAVDANSDYHPVLDLRAERARFIGESSMGYAALNTFIIPVRRIVDGDTLSEMHQVSGRRFNSRNQYTAMMHADYRAWQTWWYVTSLGTEDEVQVDSTVSRDVALKVAMLRMAAADSSIASLQMLPKYIVDLLRITMPYLPAQQMSDIWKFIDTISQEKKFPPMVRNIQTVLRHISTNTVNDTTRILCRRLLGKGEVRDNEYNRMAVAAFFIASLTCGKFEGVHELWNRIGEMRYDLNCMMAYGYVCQFDRK
jgi:predicted membrane-bound spermidine synthase